MKQGIHLDGGCAVIIKSLAELAEPDEASLVIRPININPAAVAEGVAEYRQRLVEPGDAIHQGLPNQADG